MLPPIVPNPPPATAPRTLLSMMRSHSLPPKRSGLSSISRSAAMLIASCAPSVMPSVPTPLAKPTVPERKILGFMPDLSKSFFAASALTGAEIFLAKATGRTESSAAAAAPNNKAVAGASSPVSWNMFWNTSGAFRTYEPRPAPTSCPAVACFVTSLAASFLAISVAALVASARPPKSVGAAAPPVSAVPSAKPMLGICSPIVSATNLAASPIPSTSL